MIDRGRSPLYTARVSSAVSVSPNNGYFVAHGKLQKYRMRETAIEELGLDGRATNA